MRLAIEHRQAVQINYADEGLVNEMNYAWG